jgi:uncharacterized delta-60 repeat protein
VSGARRLALSLVLGSALLGSGFAVALAAPGDPDASFAISGKRVLDYGGEDAAADVVVQPNGKIVVASFGGATAAFQITRLDPDGSPDTGFGTSGTVTPDFGGDGGEYPAAVALGPDGKIVVIGFVANGVDLDIAILQLLSNGQPDTSFDGDGKRTIALGDSATGDAVAIEPDGKIVVAGTSSGQMVVTRLTQTGAFDPSFNNGTPLQFELTPGGLFVFAGGMVRLPNGSIVLGATIETADGGDIGLARVTPNGSLDAGFSGDGIVIHDLGGDDFAGRMALQPDGKLVVAARAGSAGLLSVARFTSDGALDSGFGNAGRVGVDVGGTPPSDVLVQANGKLLAMGYNDGGRATVMRVQPGGTLDTTLNGSGQVTDVFGGSEDNARAGALQQNGAILIAGQTNQNAAVARLQGDGEAGGGPAATPGGGGSTQGGPTGGGPTKTGVPLCAGKRATIVGTARKDRLKGTRRADVIVGLGGADTITGGGGQDLICGGDGDDRLDGAAGNDKLFGQSGKDALSGAGGNDLLEGGPGNDALGGGPGTDRLLGQAGRDRLTGGPGSGDRCAGNAGRDRLSCERGRA